MQSRTIYSASGLQLFALFGLAVTGPLLDLLVRNPGFLVAYRVSASELWQLVTALLFAMPLATWLFEVVLSLVSRRLASAVHLMVVGGVTCCFALPPLGRIPRVPGSVSLTLAALLGVGVAFGFARRRGVRHFVTALAVLPPVLAAAFVTDPAISRIRQAPALAVADESFDASVPVVLLIFDGLPITSLLDENGSIDPYRYPNFTALAAQSTWFRNTSTVAGGTLHAVPALLTGKYPNPSKLATAVDHPRNLFSLLAGSYDMHVHEPRTSLFAGRGEDSNGPEPGSGVDARRLVADLGILYLHMLLPEDLAVGLPSVTDRWRGFAGSGVAGAKSPARKRFLSRDSEARTFTNAIVPCVDPCFQFLHLVLPHTPWVYSETGMQYAPTETTGLISVSGDMQWRVHEWWAIHGYQRHLLQLAFVDRILGDLLARLKMTNLYDRSLIVVASDHGASFWPDESRRNPAFTDHPEDILRVPFLLKLPHQGAGSIDERVTETIDVLPTIANVLGIGIPWEVDGCSVLDPACPERRELTVFAEIDGTNRPFTFSPDIHERSASLDRKIALFGTGRGAHDLFEVGAYRGLIGRRAHEVGSFARAPGSIEVDSAGFGLMRTHPARFRATRIVGRLPPSLTCDGTLHVAVATAGTIRAVVPALPGRNGRCVFSAMLPEAAVVGAVDELQLYVVTGTASEPRLLAAEAREADLPFIRPPKRPGG